MKYIKYIIVTLIIGLIIILACYGLKLIKHPIDNILPFINPKSDTIIVNPTKKQINDNNISDKQMKQVIHNIQLPDKIDGKQIEVKDKITTTDGIVNDGIAQVVKNNNGTIDITIPENIAIINPELRWKINFDGSLGIGYEILQWKQWSLDGNIYLNKMGVGVSYNYWHNIHIGIEETLLYNSLELKTRLYLSIPLDIR